MRIPIRVASPPPKPLLIFDGDCGFCRRWVARWQRAVGDAVDYRPFQDGEVKSKYPEIPPPDLEKAIHLVSPDGSVCRGAEAAFRSLATGGVERWMLWAYEHTPGFAPISEFLYEQVASHRESLSKLDRFFLGPEIAPPQHVWVRFVFLRGLALIYLIAFASLREQMDGLIGSQGIVPAAALMSRVQNAATTQHIGLDRFHLVPTLTWLDSSDAALHWQCDAGITLSVLLLMGFAPALSCFLLWIIYLSFTTIASPFLNFQWDILLLETGFLAIFLAPLAWRERPTSQAPPSRLVLWLLRWLIFRLMFESGWVKLASGDPMWSHLTALRVHFETQPLPTWIGWYAHQLPSAVQSACVFLMFVIELAFPLLIFAGRNPRIIAAAGFAVLQLVILLTGNYTFFNWLTILLCLPMLDDPALARFIPQRLRNVQPDGSAVTLGVPVTLRGAHAPRVWQSAPPPTASSPNQIPNPSALPRWHWIVTTPLFICTICVTTLMFPWPESVIRALPDRLISVIVWADPLRTFNSYGLFRTMTQTRPEIIVQGSNDGENWQDYEFKYKPGDLMRPPAFVAPYQPRLDWQMWFAALGSPQQNIWFLGFEKRLLENSPAVTALLAGNPFPQSPPKYIRAELYQYHFTDFATRRDTGNWWNRDYQGAYLPQLSLANFTAPKTP